MPNEPKPTGAMEKSLPCERLCDSELVPRRHEAISSTANGSAPAAPNRSRKPATIVMLDIGGESILLVRTSEGAIRAHYNVCRHRGARMCDAANDARWGVKLDAGVISRSLIRCPYHNWAYSLEGDLIAAPQLQDAPDFDKADFKLHPVGVSQWGGFIFRQPDAGGRARLFAVRSISRPSTCPTIRWPTSRPPTR